MSRYGQRVTTSPTPNRDSSNATSRAHGRPATGIADKRLRIVAWNAAQAVHRKLPQFVDRLAPDIAVIPECAVEEVLRSKGGLLMPDFTMVWVGSNPQKGLAVVAFGDYQVKLADGYDDRLQWVAPVEVSGPSDFNMLGVCAGNRRAKVQHPDAGGAPQPFTAMSVYRDWLADRPGPIVGDFNHNVRWDKDGWPGNHARTLSACADAGLVSAYHHWTNEPQGEESAPTIYWRNRTIDGPRYHIDYAFIPNAWLAGLAGVAVGGFDPWVAEGLSDHVPVTVDIDLSKLPTG